MKQKACQDIPVSAHEVRPLGTGQPVPSVMLRLKDGRSVDLGKVIEGQPAVLIFYRGGWCPYCTKQLKHVQEIEETMRRMGIQVLAISPDSPRKIAESITQHQLTYALLSDHQMGASRAFGIAFLVDEATRKKYRGYGIDLETASGETHHLLPVPSVFIVDSQGIIRFSHINPDYTQRFAPQKLLKTLRSLQLETEDPLGS